MMSEQFRSGTDFQVPNERPCAKNNYCIPPQYNENRIVLMVKDPWTLYSYWEVKKEVEDRVRDDMRQKGQTASKSILRVFDVTDDTRGGKNGTVLDFELRNWANSWYVHTGAPGRTWLAEIGIVSASGDFFMLSRSNKVAAPSYGMSPERDKEWDCPEEMYYKMFAIAGGYGGGLSSYEMRDILDKHLKAWLSSGGITSDIFGSTGLFLGRR